VPPELVNVISRCLRKRAEDRFQSSSELKLALEKVRRDSSEREALPTIAVLPFANLSADKENEYFSDGLAEEIINALTKVPGLRVTARTSSFAFRGKDVEISEIGARLKVDHILEGSVRKSGNRIRVSAQLVKVSDSYHLWSERYDREMTDVFTIQDEISQAIVEKLRVHLMGGRQPVKRPTRNLEAYNSYLKGRYHKDKVTPDGLVKGQLFFEQAIEVDPDYALAYYGLAEALWLTGYYGFRAPRDVIPKSKSATLRALELDDELAEAHAMLGMILGNYEYEWKAAEREFKRALDLDPASGVCHDRYGYYFLRPMLRLDEAVAEVQRALEIDPLSLFVNGHLAYVFHIRREYDSALAQYRSTLDLDPNYALGHWLLSISCLVCGMLDAAVAEAETLVRLAGCVPLAIGVLGAGYAATGRTDEALAMIAELNEAGRKVYVSPAYKGWIAVSMDDLDGTFECLEKAVEQRDPMMVNLNSEPFYDKLRSDPRYHALLRKMNLPP
jgi:serine/threonine-protein kinase